MTSETESESRPLSRRRKGAFALIVLLVTGPLLGLVAEGVVRVRHRLKHGTFGRIYGYAVDPASGLKIPEPGTTFGPIRINRLGFRGPEIEMPKPPGRIRLAFLGGSTTYSAETSSEQTTWPDRVCRALAERHPDLEFDYVNAGVGGFTISHSIRNLEYRVRPLEPDLIFVYHATNDLCIDSRALAAESGVYEGKPDEESWLEGWSLAWHLLMKNWRLYQRQSAARQDTDRLDYSPGEHSAGFEERLEKLLEEAKQVAPVVAVGTFSVQVRREQTPNERLGACNTSLYYMPYMTPDELLEAFDDYNRAIREAATNQEVLLVEAAGRVPGDERHFKDSVHFSDEGSAIMADLVVDALEASEAFQQLVRAHRKDD